MWGTMVFSKALSLFRPLPSGNPTCSFSPKMCRWISLKGVVNMPHIVSRMWKGLHSLMHVSCLVFIRLHDHQYMVLQHLISLFHIDHYQLCRSPCNMFCKCFRSIAFLRILHDFQVHSQHYWLIKVDIKLSRDY